MSNYLQESYDEALKEIEQLKVKLEIARKALEKSLEIDGYVFVKDALEQISSKKAPTE